MQARTAVDLEGLADIGLEFVVAKSFAERNQRRFWPLARVAIPRRYPAAQCHPGKTIVFFYESASLHRSVPNERDLRFEVEIRLAARYK